MNWGSIWSVIASILIINVFIVIHEFGHYITGKKLGFAVPEFSIGMGPRLFGWTRGETTFNVRALPIGGYCRFVGEDEEGGDDPRAMNNRPVWARMIVTSAGSVMNVVFAFLLIVVIFASFGQVRVVDHAYLYEVMQGSPAQAAGLEAGDRILSFDGQEVTDVESAVEKIADASGQQVPIEIQRGQETLTLFVTPQKSDADDGYKIGVTLAMGAERVKLSFLECIRDALSEVWMMISSIFVFLGDLFGSLFRKLFVDASIQVQGTQDVMSVVGVVGVMSVAAREDLEFFLFIAAAISANLGVMNLLPIPAMDGSRLMFQLYELITRRRIKPEYEGMVHLAGMALLLVLFVVLGWRDVARLIG